MNSISEFTEADQEIIHKIKKLAQDRVLGRTAQVTGATFDFAQDSKRHIGDHLRGLTGNGQFTFGTVVDTLMNVLGAVLIPEVEIGKAVFDQAKDIFMHGLKEAVVTAESQGTNAVERLNSAVAALSYEISNREGVANAALYKEVEQVVVDHFDEWGEPRHDDQWIEWVCDQMGFTAATREHIYDPLRQWLEHEFIGLLVQVQAELTQAAGYTSAHDSGSPEQWASQARMNEERLYHQEGERAWEDAYKMSD
ncbi:MAG: hypothetical protein QOJ34_1140 [Pseudonocardiales bacterium]|jgi:hypothetical protein|nr:hypothetical protein [Pseudonocardiales bacterium]